MCLIKLLRTCFQNFHHFQCVCALFLSLCKRMSSELRQMLNLCVFLVEFFYFYCFQRQIVKNDIDLATMTFVAHVTHFFFRFHMLHIYVCGILFNFILKWNISKHIHSDARRKKHFLLAFLATIAAVYLWRSKKSTGNWFTYINYVCWKLLLNWSSSKMRSIDIAPSQIYVQFFPSISKENQKRKLFAVEVRFSRRPTLYTRRTNRYSELNILANLLFDKSTFFQSSHTAFIPYLRANGTQWLRSWSIIQWPVVCCM